MTYEKPIKTHLDLFSGIGGFSIGFESEGFRTIAFAETDPDASVILKEKWPDVPNLGDVRGLCRRAFDCLPESEDGEVVCPRCGIEFGECDCIGTDQFSDTHGFPFVITGGVPCQPASAIGQMRGTSDERWLWPETLRVVRELSPRYCVFENPPAILVLEGGRAWNGIVSGLAALGYDCWWDVLPAAAFGAGHLRERVILIASNPNRSGLEGHTWNGQRDGGSHPRRPIATPDLRSRQLNTTKWYADQSPVQPLVDGLPARLVEAAVRCVGNSIMPQVANVIAKAINQIEGN